MARPSIEKFAATTSASAALVNRSSRNVCLLARNKTPGHPWPGFPADLPVRAGRQQRAHSNKIIS
jgi:hypothetical protein